jgi:hypothetical protein
MVVARFRRRERCGGEEVEARERARWCEIEREREREKGRCEDAEWDWDSEGEKIGERVIRWRRVERVRTETGERRPLCGWRRG